VVFVSALDRSGPPPSLLKGIGTLACGVNLRCCWLHHSEQRGREISSDCELRQADTLVYCRRTTVKLSVYVRTEVTRAGNPLTLDGTFIDEEHQISFALLLAEGDQSLRA